MLAQKRQQPVLTNFCSRVMRLQQLHDKQLSVFKYPIQ